jgi:KDO2-lipid IV(A) lauroyltransferase
MSADPSYAFRARPFAREKVYALREAALEWRDAGQDGRLAYGDVERIHVFRERFWGRATTYWACELFGRGRRIRLGSAHRVGLRAIEDRTAAYIPFAKELEARVGAANPQVRVVAATHWLARLETLGGHLAVWLLRVLRPFDANRTRAVAGLAMRTVGGLLRGQRTARANLEAAFPEKSRAEIDRILAGMWDNLGRTLVEYAWLGTLWDYDPASPNTGRVEMDPGTAERLAAIGASRTPAFVFAAHLANWELPALCGPAFGRDCAIPVRVPQVAPLAAEVSRIRARSIHTIVEADATAMRRFHDAARRGELICGLTDQHFARGIEVTMFGRRALAHPMMALFARLHEGALYGIRAIRLPGDRFRIEVTERLDPPRDAEGRIDVAATTQLMTTITEGWVREHPEQWLWLHRRWR